MQNVEKEIADALKKILKEEIGEDVKIEISRPQDSSHGDYSTNIILRIFHKLAQKYQNPHDLAEFIVNQLQKKLPNIEKIQAFPPGFINFWLSGKYLFEKLDHITTQQDNFGKEAQLRNKKIMLEFADPNPFKEFHIGHLRNITLGESYARLLEFQGADVWRVNYQGDVGMHVAKALWGVQNSKVKMQNLKSKDERSKFLGEAYALGAKAYDEDEKAKKEIEEINLKIYQKSDQSLNKLWEKGRKWSLDHFEEIYKRLRTRYKRYYFESQTAEPGREIVLKNIENKIFEKHDGAVVFRGTHTRVFVTSENYATYEAKDLALAKIKFEDFKYDRSIIITANEQIEYFKVVLEAMKKVSLELANKTIHESFGFVKLKEGKMSSRKGSVITGEWLLDEAKNRLKSQFPKMDGETLEKVAVGAVKYSMLKFSRKSDITFSFDESISLEGNSGPYLQYSYARTQSVLAKIPNPKSKIPNNSKLQNIKLEREEELLLRLLIHFPEVVKDSSENFAPNILCNFLFELAQSFNNFYQKHKIIGSKTEEFRLNLTLAVGQILKNGLFLLGIEAPEKM
ncbi:MAG: arginine--tRNA ligase [Candidatus Levybacteria bacterium]|nr:arginine--tRNA ligase [Candidatus Levybacteria bacterium]